MTKQFNFQDKIDDYLLGRLTAEEKQQFELQLGKDADLKKTVALQKEIISELQERSDIYEILNKAEKINKPKVFFLSAAIYLPIAASLLILVVLLIWQPRKVSVSELADLYPQIVPLDRLDGLMLGPTSDEDIILRGDECVFMNFSKNECEIIFQALELYQQQSFSKAAVTFNSVRELSKRNNELAFYLAISEINANQLESAIMHLSHLETVDIFEFKEDVTFFLALAYLKYNKRRQAKLKFKEVPESSPYYHRSVKILQRMRRF